VLGEAELEALKTKHGKIGEILWSGHQLVFKRPTRDSIRNYRRKQDSPAERPDAIDQLSQEMLIAFDGEQDGQRARESYLGFLTEYPAVTSAPKFLACISCLAGLAEEEDEANLGKGVSIRSSSRLLSPTGSTSGLSALPVAKA
jgi:hypothetical protein